METKTKRILKTVIVKCVECQSEFEAKGKNARYCKKCNPSKYESTKDVSYRFSVDHMLDIQDMLKKVKKNILDIEAIYIKYKNKYKKEILEKYIARIMEG